MCVTQCVVSGYSPLAGFVTYYLCRLLSQKGAANMYKVYDKDGFLVATIGEDGVVDIEKLEAAGFFVVACK